MTEINWKQRNSDNKKITSRGFRVIGTGNYDTRTNNSVKIGRNEPCHCGSGLKFKKCHLEKQVIKKIA